MTKPPRKKKKILYLITKSNWGGAQRYVYDLATHLDPQLYDVAVALGGNGRLVEELAKKNIRVCPLQNLERDISLFKEIKSAIELFHLLRREKPEILHINSSKAGGLGSFLGRLVGIPQIIFTAHGWAFNEDRPKWQKSIITYLHWLTVFLAHRTIVVSETAKSQMDFPLVHGKMQVVYNGRSDIGFLSRESARDYFLSSIPGLASYKDDFWSVTIAELHPVKQHDVVIAALEKIVATYPSARHIIIGDGDERIKLEKRIEELGLTQNVFLAGSILEASTYLKAFDLFVLGSRSEGLAYVIIEAACAGLPIIASRVGGIPEIITHRENGLLFESGNREELAEYYNELFRQPTLRHALAAGALQRSLDFTFEKMLSQTLSVYDAKGSLAS